MISLLDVPLLQSLISGAISFHEIMNLFGVKVTITDLHATVYGFVYFSRRGFYHIVINNKISYKMQCEVFIHELKHIINDMPKSCYVIGLDMYRMPFEIEADHAAEYFMQNYMKKIS